MTEFLDGINEKLAGAADLANKINLARIAVEALSGGYNHLFGDGTDDQINQSSLEEITYLEKNYMPKY